MLASLDKHSVHDGMAGISIFTYHHKSIAMIVIMTVKLALPFFCKSFHYQSKQEFFYSSNYDGYAKDLDGI